MRLEIRKRIVAEIRRHRPQVIITFDPTRFFVGDIRIKQRHLDTDQYGREVYREAFRVLQI